MKLISTKSKFLPIVVLALLLISVLLAFGKAYNTILALGQTPSLWFVLFTLLPAAFGVIIYFLLGKTKGKVGYLEAEVNSLRTALDNSLRTDVKVHSTEEKIAKIDVEQVISQIIPDASLDDMEKFGELMLSRIAKKFDIVQGLFYQKNVGSGIFSFTAGYAFFSETQPVSYIEGDTLPGQVAKNKHLLNLDKVPDGYITVLSGLGKGSPRHLLIIPVVSSSNETVGIIELASFKPFNSQQEELFSALGRKLGELLSSNKPISQD
ncbi:MAG TPA: GAF domain-containing protein [Tenuifilaceae bacterium]|nr:GAF domain-containing protein [Tenuifilaceae bacterium]HPI44077.1 GAF domain-containing protein [Tenuifilaceae bacterium]HPN21188.1 GAF domain-containing protein [Tenuifilaceae bacterium]